MTKKSKRKTNLPAVVKGAVQIVDPFLQMVERVASIPDVDIGTIERLLAMQERVTMKNAESAFNEAMRACQSEMKAIIADATNPQTKSKYASYARLDRELRPIYTRHGFAISFDTEPMGDKEAIMVLAYASRGMFTKTYRVPIPADGKGAKGGDVMTKTHAVGSAMSYGARYLLKLIFNVAVSEDDDDGNSASVFGLDAAERTKFEETIEILEDAASAEKLWKQIAAACEKAGDVRAYAELKALVAAKLKGFKVPA